MSRFYLSQRFLSLSTVLFVAGCTVSGFSFAELPTDVETANTLLPSKPFQSEASYEMYHFMVAEMLVRDGKMKQAAQHYVLAAARSNDANLVKRAAEMTLQADEPQLAKGILERWMVLSPDSMDVHQYSILLNARLGNYDEAVKDMVWVRDQLEKKEGHGFEFLVSLLALEVGPTNTFEVFKRYADTVDDSPKAHLVVASFALPAEKYADVLVATDKVLKTGDDTQKEHAARLRAKALAGLDRIDEAVAFLKPVAEGSEDAQTKLEYGRLLIMADQRQEALSVYQQLYQLDPSNADVLYTLSLLYLEKEQYTDAEPLLKKLVEIPEQRSEASYFLAQVYEAQDRTDEALKTYDDALGSARARDVVARKSQLLKKTQGLDSARSWLATLTAEASTPENKVMALMADGQLLHNEGQYEEAIKVYNQAEPAGASKRDILYARSLSYEKLGQLDKAEQDLKTLIEADAKDADALNALGYLLTVNSDRYTEAQDYIKQALALLPESPAVMDSMGWVLFKSGDQEGAEKWLRKAFETMPDPEIASHLVEVLFTRGNKDEARRILNEMLAKHPNDKMLVEVRDRLHLVDVSEKQ